MDEETISAGGQIETIKVEVKHNEVGDAVPDLIVGHDESSEAAEIITAAAEANSGVARPPAASIQAADAAEVTDDDDYYTCSSEEEIDLRVPDLLAGTSGTNNQVVAAAPSSRSQALPDIVPDNKISPSYLSSSSTAASTVGILLSPLPSFMDDSGILCDILDDYSTDDDDKENDDDGCDDSIANTTKEDEIIASLSDDEDEGTAAVRSKWRIVGAQLNQISRNLVATNQLYNVGPAAPSVDTVNSIAATLLSNTILYYCIKKIINIF